MIPTATWRIQFRNGMTFDRAASLVPYLQQLGISHLYASPIFTAARDSTHGYDVTDANEIDPSIGGRPEGGRAGVDPGYCAEPHVHLAGKRLVARCD